MLSEGTLKAFFRGNGAIAQYLTNSTLLSLSLLFYVLLLRNLYAIKIWVSCYLCKIRTM